MQGTWHPPAHVLFVADEASQLTEFAIDLMQLGYAISTAQNSAEAMLQLHARPWDAVIVDQQDVGVSMGVCQTIGGQLPRLPVVIMLAHPDRQHIEALLAVGAYDVVLSTAPPPLLHAALNRACEHHRLQQRSAMEAPSALIHDVNNALSGILGITQLRLDEPNLPPDLRDDFQQIAESAYAIRDRVRKA